MVLAIDQSQRITQFHWCNGNIGIIGSSALEKNEFGDYGDFLGIGTVSCHVCSHGI